MKKLQKRIAWSAATAVAGRVVLNQIDPYTRGFGIVAIGRIGLVLSNDTHWIKDLSHCLFWGGTLQSHEMFSDKGAKIISNELPQNLNVILEDREIVTVSPGQYPSGRIEGFTWSGIRAVYKARNNVYIRIGPDGSIKVPLLGGAINTYGGGYKDEAWCRQIAAQGDPRWLRLYELSR